MKYLLNYLPKLAYSLSGDNLFRALWLYILLCTFVLTRTFFKMFEEREYILKGRYRDANIKYSISKLIDIAPLIEIYVFNEYEWDCGFEPKTILDLGAHYGDTAIYYNAKYPNATIIAVEPEPVNFARLQNNVASFKNIIPVNCAVGPVNSSVTLFRGQNGLGNSIKRRKLDFGSIEVIQKTIDTILKEQEIEKVDLLKFDIEGAELDLFRDNTIINKSRAFIGELHFDLSPELLKADVENLFKDFSLEFIQADNINRCIIRAK